MSDERGRGRREALRLFGAGGVGVVAGVGAMSSAAATGPEPLPTRARVVVAADAGESGPPELRCDGEADDEQINAAVRALADLGGGTVVLSRGTFRLAGPIDLAPKVRVVGQGVRATVLTRDEDVVMVRAVGTPDDVLSSAGLEDLALEGADLTATVLEAHYASELLCRRVNLGFVRGWAVDAVQLYDSLFDDCRFDWAGVAGVDGVDPKVAVSVVTSRPDVPSSTDSNNVNFFNCIWESCSQGALELAGAEGQPVNKCYLLSCKMEVFNLSGPVLRLSRTTFVSMLGLNVTATGRAEGYDDATDLVVVTDSSMVDLSHVFVETVTPGIVRSFVRLLGGNDLVSLRAVHVGGELVDAAIGAIDATGENRRVHLSDDVGWWFNPTGAPILSGADSLVSRYRSAGVATCATSPAGTPTVVPHGLAVAPVVEDVGVTPLGDLGATRWWLSGVSETDFTIVRAGEGGPVDLGWRVQVPDVT